MESSSSGMEPIERPEISAEAWEALVEFSRAFETVTFCLHPLPSDRVCGVHMLLVSGVKGSGVLKAGVNAGPLAHLPMFTGVGISSSFLFLSQFLVEG